MEITVRVRELEFFAHHGWFDMERHTGNTFRVSAEITYLHAAAASDSEESLQDTISYVDIFNIIKVEMQQPRKLLETVAASIGAKLKLLNTSIIRGKVEITKITPPIKNFNGEASVEVNF